MLPLLALHYTALQPTQLFLIYLTTDYSEGLHFFNSTAHVMCHPSKLDPKKKKGGKIISLIWNKLNLAATLIIPARCWLWGGESDMFLRFTWPSDTNKEFKICRKTVGGWITAVLKQYHKGAAINKSVRDALIPHSEASRWYHFVIPESRCITLNIFASTFYSTCPLRLLLCFFPYMSCVWNPTSFIITIFLVLLLLLHPPRLSCISSLIHHELLEDW